MSDATDRAAKAIAIIGFNGTGKTTYAKKTIIKMVQNGSRALIITPDDVEWQTIPEVHHKFPHRIANYVGIRRMIFYEPTKSEQKIGMKSTLDHIDDYYRDGIILFDDCRSYFQALTAHAIHNLMIRRRQRHVDIFFVVHGFTDLPAKLFTFLDEIVLFKTMDNIDTRKNYIRDFERMKQSQAYVNNMAIKDPHYKLIIKQ